MKLGRDEVLIFSYKCCCFSVRSAQGQIKGGAKLFHGDPLQRTSSSDRKASATNQVHSNGLEACGKSVAIFGPFRNQIFDAFLTSFWT